MLRKSALAALLVTAPLAHAGDINNLQALSQSDFHALSQDLSSALSYKSLIPAAPLGITGFDIGVEATVTPMSSDGKNAMQTAAGSSISDIVVPKLHAHKGLPLNIDVGFSLSEVPTTNMKLWGAEVRWAPLPGGIATPAVGLRLATSRMSGVDQLGFSSNSLEATISKGFLNFTPYGGVGEVWSKVTPHAGSLSEESITQSRLFVGCNVNFGLFNMDFEADKTGKDATYGAKFGFRF